MRIPLQLTVAASLFAPSVALACPYARAADCGACGSSLGGYALSLLLGVAVGIGSVALQHRSRT